MSYWLLLDAAIAVAAMSTATAAVEPITTVPVVTIAPPPPLHAAARPPAVGEKSVAVPKSNPGVWANTSDYPVRALAERREGTTGFKLSVDKEGNPSTCTVTQTSGHADLDEATCNNMMRRARFYPAQNGKGAPVAGEFSSRVRWQIPEVFTSASPTIADRSFPRPPKIADFKMLQIKPDDYPADALAEGFQGRTEVTLNVNAAGAVMHCNITKTSGHTSLDQKSCEMARNWRFNPAAAKDGSAVEGISAHSFNWMLPKGSIGALPRVITERNPFEKPGMLSLTLDFDSEGKLLNCQAEHKGEFSFLPRGVLNVDQICKNPPVSRVKPFVGADGKNQPRRVVLTLDIAHQDVPDAPAKPAAQ